MEIGAGWRKEAKDRDGNPKKKEGRQVYNMSVQINVPFLGQLNFTLVPNEKKEKDAHPDYLVYWSPPREKGDYKQSQGASSGHDDYDGGF